MVEHIDIVGGCSMHFGSTKELLAKLLPQKRVIVISDTNIDRTHRDIIEPYEHIFIGQGEQAKSFTTLEEIYRKLIDMGADRSTFILGVGGGIVLGGKVIHGVHGAGGEIGHLVLDRNETETCGCGKKDGCRP